MANLKVNTVSGIGTEGVVLDGGLKFRSKNYMTLPKEIQMMHFQILKQFLLLVLVVYFLVV